MSTPSTEDTSKAEELDDRPGRRSCPGRTEVTQPCCGGARGHCLILGSGRGHSPALGV